MTESRIPEVLANRVWLTLAYHPGALCGQPTLLEVRP